MGLCLSQSLQGTRSSLPNPTTPCTLLPPSLESLRGCVGGEQHFLIGAPRDHLYRLDSWQVLELEVGLARPRRRGMVGSGEISKYIFGSA